MSHDDCITTHLAHTVIHSLLSAISALSYSLGLMGIVRKELCEEPKGLFFEKSKDSTCVIE